MGIDTDADRNIQDQLPLHIGTVQETNEYGVIITAQDQSFSLLVDISDDLSRVPENGDQVAYDRGNEICAILGKNLSSEVRNFEIDESPSTEYDDIGGLEHQINRIKETVELPIDNPDRLDELDVSTPSGILLHGPPGTGKTMLARAVANETNATFIKLSGTELVKKFIGEGGRIVRELFQSAREKKPSIIFIDELDAIAKQRTETKTEGDSEVNRTLMQLLHEMDGFEQEREVKIIGATNRKGLLDDAILRPGRFGRKIEVPMPEYEARKEIFEFQMNQDLLSEDVETSNIADQTRGMTGADIEAACREAILKMLREEKSDIRTSDLIECINNVKNENREW
jgi:proteasome regulatory subunit